ncbi:MAG: hypothetical protein MUC60_17830 [Oscillatoria sp. Prado101]|jgi:hypothetical protein|nr:hypothetical protein [Oscillatoria sp. Prado101]
MKLILKDGWFLLTFYLIPFALLLWFVASFGVNLPFWDEIGWTDIFNKVSQGKATFADFFNQHNEHRMFFPRLIATALAFATKWDIRYELYFSVFLGILTFFALYKIAANQRENQREIEGKGLFHLANFLTCMLVFSLVQWENWLWGFQIAWFLINACVAIAICLAVAPAWKPVAKLAGAAVFCFIASFSSAHGLLSWLALVPTVATLPGNSEQKRKRLIGWVALFALSAAIYSIGYQKPAYHPDIFYFLKHPLLAGAYFFSLLGSPLVAGINPYILINYPAFKNLYLTSSVPEYAVNLAPVVGGIVFCAYLFFAIHFFSKKCDPEFRIAAAPWLSLGLFAVFYASLNTAGRAGFGSAVPALISRYTTPTVFIIISAIQMGRLFLEREERDKKGMISQAYRGVAFFLMGVILAKSGEAIATQINQVHIHQQNAKTCFELVNYIDGRSQDNCLLLVLPHAPTVKYFAKKLDKIGLREFPKEIKFVNDTSQVYGFFDTGFPADKKTAVKRDGSLLAHGWAVFPDRLEQPGLVLLSHGNKKRFFASAHIHLDSPDVAKALNSSRYAKARWAVNFSAKSLPVGETAIKAWVYDTAGNQFLKLKGEFKVKVEK